MRILLVLLGLLVSGTAEAIDCNTPPSCESLGYAKADDLDCETDGYLNCPFDTSYKKCVTHNCEKLGFTKDDKTSWCGNIIKCNADTNYTLCECMKSRCEIGDVFYADGSCGKVTDYVKDSSPKPVGVVYSLTSSGGGKVINLHDLGRSSSSADFDPLKPYETGYEYLFWGDYPYDVPDLTNYDNSDAMLNGLKAHDWGLYDGKKNTETILAHKPTNCSYPTNTENYYQYCVPEAAQAAHDFYPPEVSKEDPIVGAGKWYLPALGELMDLYGYDIDSITSWKGTIGATGTTKTKVNATLQALKDKGVGNAETLTENYYYSSSEYDSDSSWLHSMRIGYRVYNLKRYDGYVRASLEFY